MSFRNIRAVICGPSECGKTTLAAAGLVPWVWRRGRLRSIVFDPWLEKHPKAWGPTAWVTTDLAAFRRAVWGTSGCAVFWDESTDSLDRNAEENRSFFSRIRHNHPALFVLMHDFCVITPMMRANLTDAFVYRQTPKRCGDWADLFADSGMHHAAELEQYEFLHKVAFRPVRRLMPTEAELRTMDFIP